MLILKGNEYTYQGFENGFHRFRHLMHEEYRLVKSVKFVATPQVVVVMNDDGTMNYSSKTILTLKTSPEVTFAEVRALASKT